MIGVLALQGDFREHLETLTRLGAEAANVRTPEAVAACDALIIPGGESTTIGKLMARFGVDEAVRDLHRRGRPIFGTCAGAILLAREVAGEPREQVPQLGLLDAVVARNAYGRQIDSFEADLEVQGLSGGPLRAVFIRAPRFVAVGPSVETLAVVDGEPVIVRQGNLFAAAFHPELTPDHRIHQLLLDAVDGG